MGNSFHAQRWVCLKRPVRINLEEQIIISSRLIYSQKKNILRIPHFGATVVLRGKRQRLSTMINQHLAQKQRLKILPQQIQLLNFFHLNTLELEQRIQQEIEDNPLLEDQKNEFEPVIEKFNKDAVQDYQDWEEYGYDDIPDYKTEYSCYLHNDKVPERPLTNGYDYRKGLKEQYKMGTENPAEIELAEYIIDSLNDYGLM